MGGIRWCWRIYSGLFKQKIFGFCIIVGIDGNQKHNTKRKDLEKLIAFFLNTTVFSADDNYSTFNLNCLKVLLIFAYSGFVEN